MLEHKEEAKRERGRLNQGELHLPGSLSLQGLEISAKMHALPASLFDSSLVRTSGKHQMACNRKTLPKTCFPFLASFYTRQGKAAFIRRDFISGCKSMNLPVFYLVSFHDLRNS